MECSGQPDVYYRPGYVRAWEPVERSSAIALQLSHADKKWLLPLLTVSRPASSGSPAARDAVTPYGYGGILNLSPAKPSDDDFAASSLSPAAAAALISELRQWCAEQKLTCCVLRLHPLARQGPAFEALQSDAVRLRRRGTTTAIDLRNWDERAEGLHGISKGRKSDLAYAQKRLRVTWSSDPTAKNLEANSDTHLAIFSRIYRDTMARIAAQNFYLFPDAHFQALRAGLPRQSDIAVAWLGAEPVAAAFFLAGTVWAHYHLSGATDAGKSSKAATLLIHEGAKWAQQRGCRLLHLGGGRKENDSLMAFKRGFGGELFEYHTLTVIADLARFQELSRHPNSPWPYSDH